MRKLSTRNDQTISFDRDPRGLETARQLPGAMRLEQRYDSVGRLVEQRVGPRCYTSELCADESEILAGHEVIKRAYNYDADGLLLSIADDRWGATNYAYDPAERLLTALRELGLDEYFEYDATDNLFRNYGPASGLEDHAFGYSLGNRLVTRGDTQFEYDSAGRLVRKTEAALGVQSCAWEYSWDALGQLHKIRRPDGKEWKYKYDAFGRRVEKRGPTTARRYLWSGDAIVHELPDRGPVVAWIMKPYSFVPLAKVLEGSLLPIITDHLGTPREMLDSSGNLVWMASLTAWGQIERIQSPRPEYNCSIRFQGQWYDEESGLHYNRFRFYDPALGRFVSPDPIGVAGGKNLYQYVANPIGGVDPLGLTDSKCTDPESEPEPEKKKPSAPAGWPGTQSEFGDEIEWPARGKIITPAEDVDLAKLQKAGVTEEWATEQAEIYRGIAAANPGNPSAALRADWLEKVANRLSND